VAIGQNDTVVNTPYKAPRTITRRLFVWVTVSEWWCVGDATWVAEWVM